MSAILIADEIVHYEVLGRGRPVILLHSWVGSWRYWISSMQAASIHCRVYALDLWGFGDSAKNPSHYALEEQASLLDEFIGSLGIGKVALVGHGLGALVALQYATCKIGSTDRIMVVGLSPGNNHHSVRLGIASIQELAEWLLDRTGGSEPVRTEALKADARAITGALGSLTASQSNGLLNLNGTPCLWVQGVNDPLAKLPGSYPIDFLPENSHRIAFEESGHFPMLDEPGKFNRLLSDFLTLEPGASLRQLQIKEEWKRRVR